MKKYQINYFDKTKKEYGQVCKFSGLQFNQMMNADLVPSAEDFEKIMKKELSIKVPQAKTIRGSMRRKKVIAKYTISARTLGRKRVILDDTRNYLSLPYGFTSSMKEIMLKRYS